MPAQASIPRSLLPGGSPPTGPDCADRSAILARLRQCCSKSQVKLDDGVIKTGWPPVDGAFPAGGLSRGALHEWIGTLDASADSSISATPQQSAKSASRYKSRRSTRAWRPPLALMIHLAHQAHTLAADREIVWIGDAVWPYPPALRAAGVSWLRRCLFLRASRAAERVAAAGFVVSSRAVAAVVIDGSGFDLNATRRLSLAAEAGGGLYLLVRPPWEQASLSAARTRWLVRALHSDAAEAPQRWTVELLRCKGIQPNGFDASLRWSLERDHATRAIVMAADVGNRSDLATHSPPGQRAG